MHVPAARIFRQRTPDLRSWCSQRIAGIPVPQPFDLGQFTRAFSEHRGRELLIRPMPCSLGTLGRPGLWAATLNTDYVLVDDSASAWHQTLISLHEIGHIACGHASDGAWTHAEAAALLPHVNPAMLRAVLGRHEYTTPEERQAEAIAGLVLERADLDPMPVTLPGQAGITARVAHTLRHPVRAAG
jgi:hypothetical protein